MGPITVLLLARRAGLCRQGSFCSDARECEYVRRDPCECRPLEWSSASPRSALLGIWLASVYELRYASDSEATLRVAGEHGLNDERKI